MIHNMPDDDFGYLGWYPQPQPAFHWFDILVSGTIILAFILSIVVAIVSTASSAYHHFSGDDYGEFHYDQQDGQGPKDKAYGP